jgi:hypothetical protein
MKTMILNLIKYIFRSLHITAFGLLFGNMCIDHYNRSRIIEFKDDKSYKFTMMLSGIILIASGLINMIILVVENKYTKNIDYKIWKNLLIFKFFASLSLTPLLEKIFPFMAKEQLLQARVFIVIPLFLMSPFSRYFREGRLQSNKYKQVPAADTEFTHKD